MNRRNFLTGIIAASVSAAILPSASTYSRVWKKTKQGIYVWNTEYVNAKYEIGFKFVKQGEFAMVHVDREAPPEDAMQLNFPPFVEKYAIRFNTIKDGKIVQIQPFIEV